MAAVEDAPDPEMLRAEGAEGGRNAADPDRLLPGEDPDSRHPEDAVHWVAVYTELIAFKEQVLGLTRRYAADGPPDVAEEVAASDLRLLVAELQRLHRRLGFWEQRRTQLSG